MDRPRTRNPRLNHLTEELEHSVHSSTGGITPTGKNANGSYQVEQLRSTNSFHETGTEVLWSESGDAIPTSQLARPPTSNPRYARDTSTPKRHHECEARQTPPIALSAVRGTPTPEGESPSSADQRTTRAVLWAADGGELEPGLIARPLTSNPWLSRVIDRTSGPSSPAIGESPTSEKQKANKSEIIWSSGEVKDWRMLARPHAANPTYEAAQSGETHTPEDDEYNGGAGGRRISEVLWSREGDNEQQQVTIEMQRQRIEELEREVRILRAQLRQHGIAPEYISRPKAPSPMDSDPSTEVTTPNRQQERLEEEEAGNGGVRFYDGDQESHIDEGQSFDNDRPQQQAHQQQMHTTLVPRPKVSQRPTSAMPRSHNHPVHHQSDDLPPPNEIDNSVEATIIDDDTPDEFVDPRLETAMPPTPKTPEASAARKASGQQQQSALRAKYDFKNRPGTAQPSRRDAPQPAYLSSTKISSAPITVDRPLSAPLHRNELTYHPTTVHSPGAEKFMSSINTMGQTISTTSLAKAEDAAMVSEYNRMKRDGEQFVAKKDFHECYNKRSRDYGIEMSDRQIARVLQPYNTAGEDYLTLAEFSILYLKLAQW